MASIVLNKIVPHPIRDIFSPQSQVWGKEVTFESGKNYHICAPSGTGKTTLSHVLYGLRHDYDGQLLNNGESAKNWSPDDWSTYRQKSISIIYQDLKLLEEYTALENIQIKNRLTSFFSEKEIVENAERLGVAYLLNKSCKTISRGERQRISILRALCQPFNFIILDEAFSHLDEANTQKAAALINEVCAKNNASVIACNLYEDHDFNYQIKLKL